MFNNNNNNNNDNNKNIQKKKINKEEKWLIFLLFTYALIIHLSAGCRKRLVSFWILSNLAA